MAWPPAREFWPEGCTPHRDGWVRWYKGKTRFVCGKTVPLDQVAEWWKARKKDIDDGKPKSPVKFRVVRTYRDVLSSFLAVCEHRVKTSKPKPMSERTLHNYAEILNDFGTFVDSSSGITEVNQPEIFDAYAKRYGGWKSSGFDSVVSRVGALFNWAVEMEYIDRWRPGTLFRRPHKSVIRDERIGLSKSIAPSDVAKLYAGGNNVMRCWIGLGICAGFINSDIANLPSACVDLESGVIDFRRRKTGRIRRVCPLPIELVKELERYRRPAPQAPEYEPLFFLTVRGRPYAGIKGKDFKPSDSVGRLWNKHREAVGISNAKFTGLRTTFYNLAPRGEWELERKIIMGRAQGTVDLDSYLEDVGMDRLRHVVNHVWNPINISLADALAQREKALDQSARISSPESSAPRHASGH